ncbi:major facilitator superfamily transporter [Colletotrichum scovillei]|uniref:Major facilitator superfamily transporter n=1 Tax=Colletotrichum scovillei TaxID=1209932 RepID=A0A9P7QS45_9PEZI|nr:major facilitator superfamily transporter [Colletotrichum scovillei]KAG7041975.1 major facilitator superfamily transporter [Colletotrichum scovillei]KAG7062006.1 major facilitator superfamily transporter [Colletotrichum scovillei]
MPPEQQKRISSKDATNGIPKDSGEEMYSSNSVGYTLCHLKIERDGEHEAELSCDLTTANDVRQNNVAMLQQLQGKDWLLGPPLLDGGKEPTKHDSYAKKDEDERVAPRYLGTSNLNREKKGQDEECQQCSAEEVDPRQRALFAVDGLAACFSTFISLAHLLAFWQEKPAQQDSK